MAGLPLLGLTMLFVAPVLALWLPQLEFLGGDSAFRRLRWSVPAGAALVAVGLLGWALATAGFDSEYPRPDQIAYELDADAGAARWISFDRSPDDWTGQFFPDDATRAGHDRPVYGSATAFSAPAPLVEIARPEVGVLSDTTEGEVRTLEMRLSSPRGTTEMATAIQAAGPILAASVDGRPLDLGDYAPAGDGELDIIYANVPATGWTLTLQVQSPEPVLIEIEEATDGLPELPGMTIAPRPADTMPSPLYPADATLVRRTFTI
jgi:hypothetical protein